MWYSWTHETSFNQWHLLSCARLGVPHPCCSRKDEIDPDIKWTTAFTDVVEVGPGDWRAFVESDFAQLYPDGLGIPCDPPSMNQPESI